MIPLLLGLAGWMGCSDITGNFDRVIAIELSSDLSVVVEEQDTVRLTARALTAAGDSVPGAAIFWVLLNPDTAQVGFTLDSATGLVQAVAPGTGRVQAAFENLRTPPITITVTPAPDSIALVTTDSINTGIDTVDFVTALGQSPPLMVQLLDTTTIAGQAGGLPNKPVVFSLVFPDAAAPGASDLFLGQSTDTVPGTDPRRLVVSTIGTNGQATAFLKIRTGATAPDTMVVEASATTATGLTVAGSPIRFVVIRQ